VRLLEGADVLRRGVAAAADEADTQLRTGAREGRERAGTADDLIRP
jgi:hypothetical protein